MTTCDRCGEANPADIHTCTPKAQPAPVQEGRDWSLLEATQESLREHMAEIKRLKEAQPAPVQEPHSWYSPDLGDYTRTKPEMGEGVTWIALFDASTPLEARPAVPEGWKLVPIAEHIYNGACPDPASPDDRDPECPACRP